MPATLTLSVTVRTWMQPRSKPRARRVVTLCCPEASSWRNWSQHCQLGIGKMLHDGSLLRFLGAFPYGSIGRAKLVKRCLHPFQILLPDARAGGAQQVR